MDKTHKILKESGVLTTFGGHQLLGVYREVIACGQKEKPTTKKSHRWDRVTCKKCLRHKKCTFKR